MDTIVSGQRPGCPATMNRSNRDSAPQQWFRVCIRHKDNPSLCRYRNGNLHQPFLSVRQTIPAPTDLCHPHAIRFITTRAVAAQTLPVVAIRPVCVPGMNLLVTALFSSLLNTSWCSDRLAVVHFVRSFCFHVTHGIYLLSDPFPYREWMWPNILFNIMRASSKASLAASDIAVMTCFQTRRFLSLCQSHVEVKSNVCSLRRQAHWRNRFQEISFMKRKVTVARNNRFDSRYWGDGGGQNVYTEF
jgi:hypothetical protein